MHDRQSLASNRKPLLVSIVLLSVLIISACQSNDGSDEESPGTDLPSLSIADASATEGDSGTVSMTFLVTLSKSSPEIVTVDYTTADGSATAGVDYQGSNGNLQFAPGDILQTISVTIQGDVDVEASETMTMTLSSPDKAKLSQANATGTINNDDFNSGLPGIDNRPDNQTCIAPARPNTDASVAVIDPFPNLPNIAQPTKMILEPVADPRWFVLRKTGQLVIFDPDTATAVSTYLDLSGLYALSPRADYWASHFIQITR